jgi:hypothetical protein
MKNMEIDFSKLCFIFLAMFLNHVKKSGDFFLNFDQILATENLIKHLMIPFFLVLI